LSHIRNILYHRLMSATRLERALDEQPQAPTPLDALRLARERWLVSGRVDMGELAAALGVSRATLYRWVGSRERLLGEVIWTFAQRAMADAQARATGSGADYVAAVVEDYLTQSLRFDPVRRFVRQDPEYALRVLASKHSQMQRRSVGATKELLDAQVAAGALEPALDTGDLAYLIVRIAESYLYSDVITGGEPEVEKAVTAIHALLRAPAADRSARPPAATTVATASSRTGRRRARANTQH
jgi:AcrR family transcriptional regulator